MSYKYFALIPVLFFALYSSAYNTDTTYSKCQTGKYSFELSLLNKKLCLKRIDGQNQIMIHEGLDSIIYSTGNPYHNINIQFASEKLGFIYGNEQGYGYWPFVFRTTDGGLNWERQLFDDHEYGAPIFNKNFYLFNDKQAILIHNADIIEQERFKLKRNFFRYYISDNGGKTWKQKKFRIETKVRTRIENSPYFLNCNFTSKGKITIHILRAPWEVAYGKRGLTDRIIFTLVSKDFGKNFERLQ